MGPEPLSGDLDTLALRERGACVDDSALPCPSPFLGDTLGLIDLFVYIGRLSHAQKMWMGQTSSFTKLFHLFTVRGRFSSWLGVQAVPLSRGTELGRGPRVLPESQAWCSGARILSV